MQIPFYILLLLLHYLLFFFSQAEDGIRDGHVTGVQTCALPICFADASDGVESGTVKPRAGLLAEVVRGHAQLPVRSEERRVGKERGCRWAMHHDGRPLKGAASSRLIVADAHAQDASERGRQ